jgi:hypothetical protein
MARKSASAIPTTQHFLRRGIAAIDHARRLLYLIPG